MTLTNVSIAAEINRLHLAATDHANDAVEHARQAGQLLLQQRAALEHGQWLSWLADNVKFTACTAQRYMMAAAPKPKSDRLSHSAQKPRPGSKRALRLLELNAVRHRDDVVAYALHLTAELPATPQLRPQDVDALTRLRDQLNQILSGGS